MTHELTFEQIQRSKKSFDKFKTEGEEGKEATLNLLVLLEALLDLGFEIGQEEISDLSRNMQLCNQIDFPTFLRITAVNFKQQELQNELISAFRAFDKNDKGTLNYKELISIITEYGPKLSIDEADKLLKELGLQNDSKEFIYKDHVTNTI